MPRPLKFKPSLTDTKRANDAAHKMYAALSGRDTPDNVLNNVPARKTRAPSQPSLLPLERDVNKEIEREAKRFDNVKLWRNNRGQVMLPNGGRLNYGVGPNGASDFIGYRRITITQDMVGHYVAQFLCVESKRPTKHGTDDQLEFIARVEHDGGVGGVAHSGEEALRIFTGRKP